MGYWIFMLLVDLLIPVIMIFTGRAFCKKAPKEINMLFGYRTAMSTKNMDTWHFAHEACGRFWYRWGLISLITVLPMFFVTGADVKIVGVLGAVICMVQMVPLLAVIPVVEKKLRQTFDKDGNRK